MKGWPFFLKWAVWLIGTPWLPLAIVALCLIIWGYLEFRARIAASELSIVLTPKWSIPVFATVINNDRDYPAHVHRSVLYGLRNRSGNRQPIHDASKFKTSTKDCRKAPYTIEPERKMEQAYGGYIPFETFKFLQAEVELENGKIFVSKKVRSPKPPSDKHKSREIISSESEAEYKPKEPQPVVAAIDELKSALSEGERLVARFQEDSVKPTFTEVEDWRKRTRDCASQNTLSSVVTAKDLLTLEKPWDQGKVLRATANFLDDGCFTDGSTHMAVFQHLWGNVERLKQLIAKIEGGVNDVTAELLPEYQRQLRPIEIRDLETKHSLDAAKERVSLRIKSMSNLWAEGKVVLERLLNADIAFDLIKSEASEWYGKVVNFLEVFGDSDDANYFKHCDDGADAIPDHFHYAFQRERNSLCRGIQQRVRNLRMIIDRTKPPS